MEDVLTVERHKSTGRHFFMADDARVFFIKVAHWCLITALQNEM
jgi:hypothetical protein